MEPSAKIICDSISPSGARLTTIEVVMHRFVLAEFNTHRVFSRNSASSRAIPVEKQLRRLSTEPAFPISWPAEQPGMQGGDELTDEDLADAQRLFDLVQHQTLAAVTDYITRHPEKAERLHKSLLNRLLEPFMWHTVIVTSSEWDNFWWQRCTAYSPLAQPEMRAAADAMHDAYRASTPAPVRYGDWHLPYVDDETREWAERVEWTDAKAQAALRKVSVARCARVSYLTHDGERDPHDDLKLCDRLTSARPMHASPLEHVATPLAGRGGPQLVPGNFTGWGQYRHWPGRNKE